MTLDPTIPDADPDSLSARRLLTAVLVLGLGLDAWLGSRLALEGLEARHVADRTASLESDEAALGPQLARRRELEQRRDVLRRNEEQLHAIAGARQLWSTKLARLRVIHGEADAAWVDRIELARTRNGASTLAIDFRMRGSDLREVAKLRERLTGDPVFFTGFDRLDAPRTTVTKKGLAPDEDTPLISFTGTFVRGGP